MSTTIIQQSYPDFMKEAMSFCEIACVKYQIPVLLIGTKKQATNLLAKMIQDSILIDPCPPATSVIGAIKKDIDALRVKARLKKLEGSSLFFFDQEQLTENDLNSLDTYGAKIVIIDDIAAVPSMESLDKWATEKGMKVIARKD